MTIPLAVERTAPLSPGQERLLAVEFPGDSRQPAQDDRTPRLRPIDVAAILTEGPLDLQALRRAVRLLIYRQSALRTTFRFVPGAPPVQVVMATHPRSPEVHHLPPTTKRWLSLESITLVTQRPEVQPTDPDLFRADIVQLGTQLHVIVLQIHHLISDGWSISLLYSELSSLYEQIVTGRSPPLPHLACSFGDYCAWLKAERSGVAFGKQLDYWRRELSAPPRYIPFPRPVVSASAACAPVNDEPVEVGKELLHKLRAVASRAEVRGGLAGPMLTAIAVAFRTLTGATEVRIGTMVSGRTSGKVEHLIGNFVNTVTIRVQLEPQESLKPLVAHINAKVATALDHQDVPIQDVITSLPPVQGRAKHEPLYDITFALNTMGVDSLRLQGMSCSELRVSPTGESRGPRLAPTGIALRWVLIESDESLAGSVTYDMGRFVKQEIKDLLGLFRDALCAIAADADSAVKEP